MGFDCGLHTCIYIFIFHIHQNSQFHFIYPLATVQLQFCSLVWCHQTSLKIWFVRAKVERYVAENMFATNKTSVVQNYVLVRNWSWTVATFLPTIVIRWSYWWFCLVWCHPRLCLNGSSQDVLFKCRFTWSVQLQFCSLVWCHQISFKIWFVRAKIERYVAENVFATNKTSVVQNYVLVTAVIYV
jgi:predicted metal-binding transcription factor (methanogenesis marker protein 9)